jgi:hypothetical protein
MASGRSRADLLTFLDYLGQKGLIPPATASARKASANKVLAILSEEEGSDVTLLDLESVFTRFGHLHKSDYSPDSLQTYVSRTRTSLDDFKRYCDDPLNFRPKGSGSPRSRAANSKTKPGSTGGSVSEDRPIDIPTAHAIQVLPISIRSDVVVKIAGLPHNLTKPEAQKLANIILAHAMPDE